MKYKKMKHWEHTGDTDEPIMWNENTEGHNEQMKHRCTQKNRWDKDGKWKITQGYNLQNKIQDVAELIIQTMTAHKLQQHLNYNLDL